MSSFTAQGAFANSSRDFNIKLNYGQIAIITALSSAYLIIASMGIDMFSKCKELEGDKVQQDLNKWIIATLAIAITIPFTLFIVKVTGTRFTSFMMLLFALMGIVGSAASLHWSRECKGVDTSDKSIQIYSGINVASFTCLCLISMYLMRPKSN